MNPNNILRVFAAYLVGFFLIVSVLTAFVIVPKITDAVQRQHERDSADTLQIESELLRRHVKTQVQTLTDLAALPAVTNAVLLSSASNQNFLDLMDNFTIGGAQTPVVLQNIIGGVIYRTKAISQGVYGTLNPVFDRVIAGQQPFGFEMLPSEINILHYKLSVPVLYQGSREGLLSVEIKIALDKIFSPQLFEEKTAFIIRQGSLQVKTPEEFIKLPEEFSQKIPDLDVVLVFIRDRNIILSEQNQLRNIILLVLLFAMALSFVAFMVLGYRSLISTSDRVPGFKREALAIPAGMGGLGLALGLLASLFTYNYQIESAREELVLQQNEQLRAIENRLVRKMNVMKMMTGLFEASDSVTRDEFNKFTHRIFESHQDIRAITWAPFVKDEARVLFEKHGQSNKFSLFQIREIDDGGTLVAAKKRDAYFPAFYVAPKSVEAQIYGLDYATEKTRKQAIELARKKGALVVTGLLRPIRAPNGKPEVMLFSPVTRNLAANKKHFVGVVTGAFLIKDIVSGVQGSAAAQTDIVIEDVTDPSDPMCILCNGAVLEKNAEYLASRILNVGGRQWKLSAYPKALSNQYNRLVLPLIILISGVFMSFFVSYSFWQLIRRRKIVEAEVQLRTNEVRELSEAMEKTVEGVSRIDPDGRYTYLNEAYASTCGYTPEELTGEKWTKTVHEDDHEMMEKEYQTMLDTGIVSAEPRGVRKDGSIFYKNVTMMSRYDDEGNFIGHHCFMTDISKRKQAELELLRSNSDLDDFAYIASHDLKEPLRGIHNHAKLYVEDYGDNLDEEASRRMSRIIYLSQRMEKLINDLLYYSRLGRQASEFETVDLNELVIQEQRLMADEETVMITLMDKLPTIKCDRLRTAELFRNLIANGVKYNDSKLKKIAIGVNYDHTIGRGAVPIFYVRDNGIGIDARFHKDIFKIFKRLHKKDAYGGGSGSGLTFVKKIVEQHKGEIWLTSEPGQGTTFYFTLGKVVS